MSTSSSRDSASRGRTCPVDVGKIEHAVGTNLICCHDQLICVLLKAIRGGWIFENLTHLFARSYSFNSVILGAPPFKTKLIEETPSRSNSKFLWVMQQNKFNRCWKSDNWSPDSFPQIWFNFNVTYMSFFPRWPRLHSLLSILLPQPFRVWYH